MLTISSYSGCSVIHVVGLMCKHKNSKWDTNAAREAIRKKAENHVSKRTWESEACEWESAVAKYGPAVEYVQANLILGVKHYELDQSQLGARGNIVDSLRCGKLCNILGLGPPWILCAIPCRILSGSTDVPSHPFCTLTIFTPLCRVDRRPSKQQPARQDRHLQTEFKQRLYVHQEAILCQPTCTPVNTNLLPTWPTFNQTTRLDVLDTLFAK